MTIQHCYKLYIIFLLTLFAAFNTQGATPSARQQLEPLFDLATRLSEQARSGNAAASRFRIDTVFYRESLRELMLAQENSATPLSKDILMEFVRMSALLQSAADCRTGRYIVCPAALMQQLSRQQKLLADTLPSL
ncbi:hypothetical protein MNBD_GAMMA13-966 [hydrothermal vent metagenome]|uniref:Uncharacterized protein n=1 Tax=hydrothermal vent metagenome TaxID=652676 RepID=A0A3B0YWD6_9ZZZZ